MQIERRIAAVQASGQNPQVRANEVRRLRARLSQLRQEELFLNPSLPIAPLIESINQQIADVRRTVRDPRARTQRIRALEQQRTDLLRVAAAR